MPCKIGLAGKRFGRLTVINESDRIRGLISWLCKCDCGSTKKVLGSSLRSGNTQSCGCIHKEQLSKMAKSHGESSTPEYSVWRTMVRRCHNKTAYGFKHYGGRGIIVCLHWRFNVENFIKDMGRRPSVKHTLERINNDTGYSAGNCEWILRERQNMNMRKRTDNTSGCPGVYETKFGTWASQIQFRGTVHHLGTFSKKEAAITARKKSEQEIWGKN